MKKIYIIWIGGIGVSAIARYHLHLWNEVFWSDKNDSELIQNLIKEWCNITVGNAGMRSEDNNIKNNNSEGVNSDNGYACLRTLRGVEEVIYTEAIPDSNEELILAKELWIALKTYPEALAEIVNIKKLIAISWTHWKSTTTSLASLVLKDSRSWVNTIVWTILKEFWNKNAYFSESEYFVIEACEYKRSFLKYKPTVWVITNIEIDHLDYYKDLDDYLSAFEDFLWNIVFWGFAILNWNDENCKKLIWKRADLIYIEVYDKHFIINSAKSNEILWDIVWEQKVDFPEINMQVPGEHILYDAHIAFIVWYMAWAIEEESIETLENYTWVWRRMEIIWETKYWNTLISDYGHHPTEIRLTLKALKEKYSDKKIFTIFQPHQYNRTLELLEDFKECFSDTDKLIIPNIYESRDSEEDKKKINTDILVGAIKHSDVINWKWLKNTLGLIKEYDDINPNSSVIVLMWAGDVDNLRYELI